MLNRGLRILWVKVHVNDHQHIHLTLPISLYALNELLDCLIDLLEVACFFSPRKAITSSNSVSVHAMKDLTQAVIQLLNSLTGCEPYDLIDVEVDHVKVSVKIR